MEKCGRCGKKLNSYSTSFFSTEVVCTECKTEEREAPHYAVAKAAEEAAVKAGNYNFPGAWETETPGYTAEMQREDQAYLAERRKNR